MERSSEAIVFFWVISEICRTRGSWIKSFIGEVLLCLLLADLGGAYRAVRPEEARHADPGRTTRSSR